MCVCVHPWPDDEDDFGCLKARVGREKTAKNAFFFRRHTHIHSFRFCMLKERTSFCFLHPSMNGRARREKIHHVRDICSFFSPPSRKFSRQAPQKTANGLFSPPPLRLLYLLGKILKINRAVTQLHMIFRFSPTFSQ